MCCDRNSLHWLQDTCSCSCVLSILTHNLYTRPCLSPASVKDQIGRPSNEASAELSTQQRHRLNRKTVIWCVLNGRPWAAAQDLGLKMMLAEIAPEYVGSMQHADTLNGVLQTMFDETKQGVIENLKTHRGWLE